MVWNFLLHQQKKMAMELLLSLMIVVAGFTAFAAISYFLVKSTFVRIDNDDWEERYVQFKKDAESLHRRRKKYGDFQKSKIAPAR
jgi:hypothetical protein